MNGATPTRRDGTARPTAPDDSGHPLDRLAELAAGTLDSDRAATVRAHLAGCESCSAELRSWSALAGAARDRAARLSAAGPSAVLADRIAAEIAGARREARGRGPLAGRLRRRVAWLIEFAVAQVPIVRHDIWAASAVVMAIGAGVSLVPFRGGPGDTLSLFAPLAAAIGIAMIYGQENDPSIEVALATPVSPRLVVVARLVDVLAFDLALALAASALLAAVDGSGLVLPIVGLWLGPMLLLGCLSLMLSLIVGTPGAILVAGALWLLRGLEVSDGTVAQRMGGLVQVLDPVWQTSLLTVGLAAAAFSVAMLLAPRVGGLPSSSVN
jgi:anti-sigma factor RsiW